MKLQGSFLEMFQLNQKYKELKKTFERRSVDSINGMRIDPAFNYYGELRFDVSIIGGLTKLNLTPNELQQLKELLNSMEDL